jgi:hypothetical protein
MLEMTWGGWIYAGVSVTFLFLAGVHLLILYTILYVLIQIERKLK